MKLPLWRVAELTSGCGTFNRDAVAEGYSIDSRTLTAGQLFFAIHGERLDGHDYVERALGAGAMAAVVDKAQAARFHDHSRLIQVADTTAALQALGAGVRRLWGKPLIAITGSAGKTTTKEATAHVLGGRWHVLKSEGNLNNHWGLPLQLLRLEPEHDLAVVELGMSHAGEIAALTDLAQPNVGAVTMVAPVHLEFFDSIAGIARAKYELIAGLQPGSTAVLNADDSYVSQFGRDFPGKVLTFGLRRPADVCAHNIEQLGAEGMRFVLVAGEERAQAAIALVGEHNLYNALAAAAVALDRGMCAGEIAAALATLRPADKRGEVIQVAGATVLNDCYNSNPKALNAMVDALASLKARRRIAVAGEMLELGPAGEELHRACGRHMAERKIDVAIGVRGLAGALVEAASAAGVSAQFVETPEEAGEWLAREAGPGDAVLLKASRGVRLERALERWKQAARS
ncbi:MAG TPA: UDP-N-acetylmuramoyl-tripeptide--D-alanyl-D-alanine ligase [Terriglobales bacterium]|nr:UDP-N-acetylmuramoyl-tripeptide--D-alanyl-D-alanine ligase [Terriglobales bacterium]